MVDTTVIIDFLRHRTEAMAFLDDLSVRGELISHPVVIVETLQGARDQREPRQIDALADEFADVLLPLLPEA